MMAFRCSRRRFAAIAWHRYSDPVEQSEWNDAHWERLALRLEHRIDRLEWELREERSKEEWRRRTARYRVYDKLFVGSAYLAAAFTIGLAILRAT